MSSKWIIWAKNAGWRVVDANIYFSSVEVKRQRVTVHEIDNEWFLVTCVTEPLKEFQNEKVMGFELWKRQYSSLAGFNLNNLGEAIAEVWLPKASTSEVEFIEKVNKLRAEATHLMNSLT